MKIQEETDVKEYQIRKKKEQGTDCKKYGK